MNVEEEINEIIKQEENALEEVLKSLDEQKYYTGVRLNRESGKAQNLNAKIVAATRDEDKQIYASDEAVSYQLANSHIEELKNIDRLIKKPYFARIILDEEVGDKNKEIEYRIGYKANPDCRIIDWRSSELSKLYYEYNEGDIYSETIQGRDRDGVIKQKTKVEISDSNLSKISCRHGTFVKNKNSWEKSSRKPGSSGKLPDVLSLITKEQFSLITSDAESAVLIQGVAGSGKTTVALYRLSWLLHEDNSELNQSEAIVIVNSKTLKSYVDDTLPSLHLDNVKLFSIKQWLFENIKKSLGTQFNKATSTIDAPQHIRLKQSIAIAKTLEELFLLNDLKDKNIFEIYELLLSSRKAITEKDESNLIDLELIIETEKETIKNLKNLSLSREDLAILTRINQLKQKQFNKAYELKHIVLDEAQDYSFIEFECILDSVKDLKGLTVVGDTAQHISSDRSHFPGWNNLKRALELKNANSTFVELTVSHRSTLEIMRFADYLIQENRTTTGRKGKAPLWFHCQNDNYGINEIILWLERVTEKFPNELTAVLCRNIQEAQEAYRLLTPKFGNVVRLGDESYFSFEEGIVVSYISCVKGLEFANVLLWNPSKKLYSNNRLDRNLLYVAATRAQNFLTIVTWDKPSQILPGIYSKLVRGLDKTTEEAID